MLEATCFGKLLIELQVATLSGSEIDSLQLQTGIL